MKIGIFGGTFNPIHNGHILAGKAAIENLHLDKLFLIPDNIPPHKELPNGSPDSEKRLEMVELACGEYPYPICECLDMEVKRKEKSYTLHTMQQLHEQYPDDELYLLMGSDMFLSFHTWYQPEEICKLGIICPFHRVLENEEQAFLTQKQKLENEFGARILFVENENRIELSSTQVRQTLKNGGGQNVLPGAVFGFIQREGLYEVKKDLTNLSVDELRNVALSYLKPKRMPHVLGTEQEAVRLCKRYGENETDCRRAALLHDCTKKLSLEQQLQTAEKYHVVLDELEKTALKLQHSRTGAAIAETVFHENERVISAIRYHTTGKPDMNLLEKILFIADYIEPSRKDFPGLMQLRKLAYENIDEAVLLGLELTIKELTELGSPIHHLTMEARDYYKEEVKE